MSFILTPASTSEVSDSIGAGVLAMVVRIEGLALGGVLQVGRAGELLTATLNDEYTFANYAAMGSSLDIAIVAQRPGQSCAVSELAPGVVPLDSSPVFIRCRSVPVPSVVVSETLPGGPLRVLRGASAVRAIAYPGLAYESRLGVDGGTFPYEFRIAAVSIGGAPVANSTVSIDFRHGTLRFTPTTAARVPSHSSVHVGRAADSLGVCER